MARLRDTRIIGKANEVNTVRKKSHDFEDTESKRDRTEDEEDKVILLVSRS